MELAHAGDDRLAGLLVRADPEGRVLLAEGEQRPRQLVLVGLRLGLDRDVDDWLGELERLEHDRVRDVAKGVAGGRRLEANHRDDVAGVDRVAVLPVVRVHLEDPADALLAVPARVENRGALLEGAGIDPQVRELADERVAHDLERQ